MDTNVACRKTAGNAQSVQHWLGRVELFQAGHHEDLIMPSNACEHTQRLWARSHQRTFASSFSTSGS